MRDLIRRLVLQAAAKAERPKVADACCACGVSPEDCRDRKIWEECGIVPAGADRTAPSVAGYEVRHEP